MPSESEWESQKDVIRELYLNQDYTLKALRDRMNSADFLATKSQYETKFKAWGFSKNDTNIPAATWKHVGYKIAKRKRKDEDSAVFIDGVEVNHKKVKKEISRYTYSTIERVQLESIGAPSPPGPLAVVATPPSSQQAFNVNYWPGNLPWLAFVGSLKTRIANFHQANQFPQTFRHGLSTPQSRAQLDVSTRNDTALISGDWQRLAPITTGRERLDLIRTILPHSSDSKRIAEIQNSISLLSTTSSHWALKLLIYLASNNSLQPEDLDHIWRLVEETGIKELANLSKSLRSGEKSLKAALEYLFEAGVWASRTDIVSWLLDIGVDPNRRIRSIYMPGSHLPIVAALLWPSTSLTAANSMVQLLLSKGASTLMPCCKEHNTATHWAMMSVGADATTLELFLQAARKAQSHQLSPQYPKSIFQEDRTNSDDCEAQQNRDTMFVTLESLVDVVEKHLYDESPSYTTVVSPQTLMEAVESNNHRLIRIIHKRGLSMNCCDDNQEPLLVRGLKLVDLGVEVSTIELLLELGASPNYDPCSSSEDLCSRALQTAIHNISPGQQEDVARLLIRNGATIQGNVSCGNANHQNLMHCAMEANIGSRSLLDDNVPILLHEAGLPFPMTCLVDYMKYTKDALEGDFLNPKEELDRLLPVLISETTDMSLQSEIGWTALDYALYLEMEEAGELMLEKGAVHSYKFMHDYCFSDRCQFDQLETLFRRVPPPRSDKQRRTFLFCRIIGTIRAEHLTEDAHVSGVRQLIQDYRKLPRSRRREAYIIRDACKTGAMYLIGLFLELFPSTYSPAALEELIRFQTTHGVDNWKFIEELLKRRVKASSSLHRLQDPRIFLRAVLSAWTFGYNSKVLEWFHDNSKEAFEFANLHPSAFWINVTHCSTKWGLGFRVATEGLNMNQLYKYGLKTAAYPGLLAVDAGRVDQINDLLHHGMRPNRRFAWSLTLLQLAVAREDLPISRRLLETGADVNGSPPWRDISESIERCIPFKLYSVLTTDFYQGYTKRRSALQLAVEQGNLSMIRLMLENGADLNGPPARVRGATAIQIACMKGYIDIARFLIDKGADVNGVGAEYFGRTALEGAAEHGRLDTVFLLLESGCRVHGSFRSQYIRAVGFANAQAHHTVAKELQDYGDWTNDDQDVLNSTDLSDIQPESRDLEEEWYDDEDVSEIDSEDLQSEEPDPYPFEMDSESEFGDYSSGRDDKDATSSGQSTPKGIVDECGSSERGPELPAVRLDTWDDLLEYYGDDEGL